MKENKYNQLEAQVLIALVEGFAVELINKLKSEINIPQGDPNEKTDSKPDADSK